MPWLENNLTPLRVENLTGISNVEVRDLRRRGMFESLGWQDENKRWKYSLKDALRLWIYRYLASNGMTREIADSIAEMTAVQLFFFEEDEGFVWQNRSSLPWEGGRFYLVTPTNGTWESVIVDDIPSNHPADSGISFLVDLKAIADRVPNKLVQEILTALASQDEGNANG